MSKSYLIPPHERLGLSRVEAAEFIGVSPTLFDSMVADGRMPPPREANSRVIWVRRELEKYFFDLPHRVMAGENSWDVVDWSPA